MIFYVIDTTLQPPQDKRFGTYQQMVNYLETMSVRAYGQNRKERMILLEECGHGGDDSNSVTFVRSMAEAFDMGVVREGRRTRCDITTIQMFQDENYGN